MKLRSPLQSLIGVPVVISMVLIVMGCAHTSTTLQSVTMSGTAHEPTIHLKRMTAENGFRLSPWLNVYSERERNGRFPGHTKVNGAGNYQLDTTFDVSGNQYFESKSNTFDFKGQNFKWTLPTVSGGMAFDLDIFDRVAIMAGLGLSIIQNETYWSGHAGMGYSFGDERIAGRIEGALTWETVSTTSQFVTRAEYFYSNKTQVWFYDQEERRMRMGGFGSLTIQSTGEEVVYYGQIAMGSQQIVSVNENRDHMSQDQADVSSLTFVSITPGLAFKIGENMRLVTGIRFISNSNLEGQNSPFLIVPLAQLDLSF
jgi:hypothetical protein